MTIGGRIRETREAFGWSQDTLSDVSGIRIEAIRHLECGQCDPAELTLIRLADALTVRLDWLLTGSGDMVNAWETTRAAQVRSGVEPELAASGPWRRDEAGQWRVWRTCPRCRDHGFTYDDVEYDGFYSVCHYCDGSGQLYRPELGKWTAYMKDAGD